MLNIKVGITQGYIDNLVKCRPPENRDPTEEEITICTGAWLDQQLALYKPKIIVAMGRYSIGFFRGYTQAQTKSMAVMNEMRRFEQNVSFAIVPTCHPAYLCRNSEAIPAFTKQLELTRALYDRIKYHQRSSKIIKDNQG
jgi:DNA polymerase